MSLAARLGHRPSLAAALGMAFFFGLTFPAQKAALNGLPPLTMTALRNWLAFAGLLLVMALLPRGPAPARPFPWRLALLLALIEPCGYYSFEAFGIRLGTAGGSALIVGLIPVTVMVLQIARGKHRARLAEWFAIALSAAGAALVAGLQGGGWLPSLLMLCAVVCASVYAVLYEGADGALDPLALTRFQALAGALFFTLLALPLEPASRAPAQWPRPALWAVLYLGIGGSVLAYFLWNYALRHRPARQVAIFSNLVPLVGALGARWLLGEPLPPGAWAGGALVIGAACLAIALEPAPPPVAETA